MALLPKTTLTLPRLNKLNAVTCVEANFCKNKQMLTSGDTYLFYRRILPFALVRQRDEISYQEINDALVS